jgi:translation elongation factor EF-Tu-like GTPase
MHPPNYRRPPREPDIEAEITALNTSEGGRRTAMYSGYRPNHDFGVDGMLNDAQHEYVYGKIEPGHSGEAFLWFLAPEIQQGRLFEGMKFTVQEGRRIVGYGKVTKVINQELKTNT